MSAAKQTSSAGKPPATPAEALVAAGPTDAAFHVDLTQGKGYAREMVLNALRDRYIERARGPGK